MIKDKFEALIELLEVKKVQSPQAVHELLDRANRFFKQLNQEFSQASKEEKEELVKMLASLQQKLQDKIQQFCSESGISEDQIYQMSQDTSKLPPNQRELVLTTKKEIADMSKNIRSHLVETHAETKTKKKESSGDKKKHKRDRGGWTKS